MNWTDLLTSEIEAAYGATEGLMRLAEGDDLTWKPEAGDNWMTTGQLLMHTASACGGPAKGFVTGDWGMPPEVDPNDMPEEHMLPPAETLPSVSTVAEALAALAADKQLALDMIAQAEARMEDPTPAPWAPDHPASLGQQLLGMVNHLSLHKAQLFYYLKMQGKPVNTMNLFGMA